MEDEPCSQGDGRITRRRFVRDAGVATVAAADVLAAPAIAAKPNRRRRKRQTVAVFGGGVAGLTAAHELAERGFDVTVYERRAWGGKARSMDVPHSAMGGREPLPAEHGFRIVYGTYQNLPDTMRRIPFNSNRDGVYGNLVEAPIFGLLARDGGRTPFTIPFGARGARAVTPAQAVDLLIASLSWLPATDLAQVVARLVVFLSSCQPRRYRDWEYQTWSDFMQADRMTEGGRLAFVNYPTRFAAQSLARANERPYARPGVRVGVLQRVDRTGRRRRPGRSHERGVDRPVADSLARPPRAAAAGAQGQRAQAAQGQDRPGQRSGAARDQARAGRLVRGRAARRLGDQALDQAHPGR
jgi:putative NAD(P)-binding protein